MSETLEPALPDRLDAQAEELMHRLCDKGLTVATAESCTGGMLAALLTDIEGAGHGFERGFVTYSKESKAELLGIEPSLLDHNDAVSEIEHFYANYHSLRFVDRALVLRLQHLPSEEDLEKLNDTFGDILTSGRIEPAQTSPAEIADHDHVELPRLRLRFDRTHWARLRRLIDALNATVGTD